MRQSGRSGKHCQLALHANIRQSGPKKPEKQYAAVQVCAKLFDVIRSKQNTLTLTFLACPKINSIMTPRSLSLLRGRVPQSFFSAKSYRIVTSGQLFISHRKLVRSSRCKPGPSKEKRPLGSEHRLHRLGTQLPEGRESPQMRLPEVIFERTGAVAVPQEGEQFRTQLGAAIDSVEFVKRALDRQEPSGFGSATRTLLIVRRALREQFGILHRRLLANRPG